MLSSTPKNLICLNSYFISNGVTLARDRSIQSSNLHERQVIDKAYAATLDPERLEDFELFWEAYLDSGQQKNGMQSAPVNLSTVSQHIFRALEILERLRHTHVMEGNAQYIVNKQYGFGFIVNCQGKIIARNSDAIEKIQTAASISCIGLDSASLSEIKSWLATPYLGPKKPVCFKNVYFDDDKTPTCLFLTSVDLKMSSGPVPERFFLITSVQEDIHPEAKTAIQNMYSLNASEVDIAFHLANGHTPKDISLIRASSLATVRTQIKYIRDKMDCGDIPDIVRKFCNMSARYSAVTSQLIRSESSLIQKSFAKIGSLTLRDGRYMEYVEQGHPNGRPVLHMHSLMNGPKQSGRDARLAVTRNWRFISPSRAGYGNSDRNKETGITGSVNSTADDMAELIAHLGLNDVTVIGSIYAQNFAFKYPELVSNFVCVNKVPSWHISELAQLQRRQRNMIKTSLYAPQLSKFTARLAKILMDTGREDVFIKGLSKGNRIDMEILDQPDYFRIVADGMKHSFKQGIDAFTLDVQGHHTDWTENAKTLQAPVTIILGSDNAMQTDFGLNRYLSAVPNAKVYRIEGTGIYFPITHFHKILDILDTL